MDDKFVSVVAVKKKLNYIIKTYISSPFIKEKILTTINKIPVVDVVEAVRCKNCKHYVHSELCYCRNKKGLTDIVKPDDFCSYGERKELDNG